jgi:hypothetical protein
MESVTASTKCLLSPPAPVNAGSASFIARALALAAYYQTGLLPPEQWP